MPVLQSYQSSYQKTDLPHENFTSVSKIAFSGGNIFKKIFCWNFLSFRGLLYVLGHFKQKRRTLGPNRTDLVRSLHQRVFKKSVLKIKKI